MRAMTPENPGKYKRLQNMPTDNFVSLLFVLVWLGYLFLSPYYVFESGLPQPADLLIAVGMMPALCIMIINYKGPISWVYLLGGLFTILTATINVVYYIHLNDSSLIRPIFFYVFNFLVFCFCCSLFSKNPVFMNKATYAVIAVTIIMQAVYILLWESGGRRHIGTFNNPNQLGHWTLIIAAAFIALKREKSINFFDLFVLAAAGYIETKTLSKAGMVSYGLLVFTIVFQKHTDKKIKYVILLILSIITLSELTAPKQMIDLVSRFENMNNVVLRITGWGAEKDDNLLVRGYGRLIEYPHYMLLGAGEGAYWRFNSRLEIHASLAVIVFSYGLFGLLLFLSFLYFIFRRVPLHYVLLLIPIMIHGLVHQNIRNTVFWIFLAIIYSWHSQKKQVTQPIGGYDISRHKIEGKGL